jgi:hypothetical protein
MAYARFARDSDVYVYADTRGGFTCERCPGVGEEFRCGTAAEMVTHLLIQHRAKGQRVPDDAINELRGESDIYGSIVDVLLTDDRKYKAEITWRRDGLFQVWLFREVEAGGEYGPEAYWSPLGRDAILVDTLERAKLLAEAELRSYAGD